MVSDTQHMGHTHTHAHGPSARDVAKMQPRERSKEKRSLILTLLVTASIMVLEAVGGWLSGSLALQADAGHMLADSSSLVLAIVAISFAARPADPKRTFGFYRAEILAALANGVALLVVAAFIFWEGIQRLRSPEEIHVGTMLLVAGIGLGANLVGIALLHGRSHASLNLRGAYLHVLGDALSSVGVLVAGVVIWATGWLYADAIISLLISLVIVWGALRLVREAVDVLLEAVPAHLDLAEVLHAMEDSEGVSGIHDLHIWTISSGMHALSAHVVVSSCDLGQNDAILGRLRGMLLDRFGLDHVTLQIETPAHCAENGLPC
jgi:cobalt-zinc-cadmium efflux system protein